MLPLSKSQRRKTLAATPFPSAWRAIIENRFPLFHRLSAADQRELEGHVQIFLAEKKFEGCDGLIVTDEMRVSIAAQACLLLLHRETDYYPRLRSILIYPDTYFARSHEHLGAGVMIEGDTARLGEAWEHGAVVLAWNAVDGGAAVLDDGENLVFHEFAHLLDYEDGHVDGAPQLAEDASFFTRRHRYRTWAKVLGAEYKQLRREAENGEESLLSHYGATNPAEFFAVATECFFERPQPLKEKHPALYEELKGYYHQDPATWQHP